MSRWFVFGQDQYVTEWVKERIPHALDFGACSAIGLADDDRMIAGIVYHNWLEKYGNIEISMAADSAAWATPEAIKVFLSYPFKQLRCRRVTTCTPASNKRALRFNYGIGFHKEGLIRQGYGTEDMVICGMVYSEAKKWLKKGAKSKESAIIQPATHIAA